MTNLTLSIDDKVLEEARKRALERGTSVNSMVRRYLEEVSGLSEKRRQALAELENLWKKSNVNVGDISWNRAQLHER